MSLLVKNASVWHWNTSTAGVSPQSVSHSVIRKKWIEVTENGRFLIPDDSETELTSEQEGAFSAIIDAVGRLILPGLVDAHIHVAMTGESVHFVDLKDCRSMEQLVNTVQSHIEKNMNLSWVIGVNWDQTKLGRYPRRQDIDPISRGLKVFLWRACWHIGLANSAALETCGISLEGLPNPVAGGVIDHDGTSVTGILRERAVEMIMRFVSNKSKEEKTMFIKNGLDMCLRFGLTCIQSNDEAATEVYDELVDNDQLPIRVFLTPTYHDIFGSKVPDKDSESGGHLNGKHFVRAIVRPDGIASGGAKSATDVRCPASRLVVDRVKIFGDGSLGAETAAMRVKSDSGDKMGHIGVLLHQTDDMRAMIVEAKSSGYRLEVHAIGDAAAQQVLQCMQDCGINPLDRAILTHCQVLGADLVKLMADMGIIANIQPSFVPTDMEWALNRLPPDTLEHSYAWKTLMKAGVWCAGGSDAPVETCSPWVGIYDAMFRQERLSTEVLSSPEVKVFRPEERLTFEEALWMYTAGGAYAGNCEGTLGRIENGAAGDFILVDPDIVKAGTDARCKELLHGYSPDVVVVGGEIVHVSSEAAVPIERRAGAHRGLQHHTSKSKQILMEGPYIPGRNGSFTHIGDGGAKAVTEMKQLQYHQSRKRKGLVLCQKSSILGERVPNMFSGRPSGSCVCLLTGAWLLNHSEGECGMKLREQESISASRYSFINKSEK